MNSDFRRTITAQKKKGYSEEGGSIQKVCDRPYEEEGSPFYARKKNTLPLKEEW